MPAIEIPTFLRTPVTALVRCEGHRALSGSEIACAIMAADGEQRVVITGSKFFDLSKEGLWGTIIAEVQGTHLVDFPSGDRMTISPQSIILQNNHGSSL